MAPWPFARRATASAPMAERVRAHIHTRLAERPALRALGAVVSCEEIAEGNNSEIWRVECERGRVIARFWRVEARRDKAADNAHVLGLAASLGLPAPRLIDLDTTRETEREFGFHVTVEELVEGRPLEPSDLRDGVIRGQLVAILLRMHAHTGEIAGQPWSRANREHPWDEWMPHRIGILLGRARDLKLAEAGTLAKWEAALRRHQPPLTDVLPFNLIHGDVHPRNCLLGADGALRMIDFGAVAFAPFELELVTGEASFEMAEAGSFVPLLDAYLATSPERRERWERNQDHLRAFDLLRRAVSAHRKTLKARHAARHGEFGARGERFWNLFAALMERLA